MVCPTNPDPTTCINHKGELVTSPQSTGISVTGTYVCASVATMPGNAKQTQRPSVSMFLSLFIFVDVNVIVLCI